MNFAELISRQGGKSALRKTDVQRSPGGTPVHKEKKSDCEPFTTKLREKFKVRYKRREFSHESKLLPTPFH